MLNTRYPILLYCSKILPLPYLISKLHTKWRHSPAFWLGDRYENPRSLLLSPPDTDHAETRRGKPSVNRRWDITRSAMCGDYILAVAAKVLAQIRNEDVLIVLAQVLADLVQGKLRDCFPQQNTVEAWIWNIQISKTFKIRTFWNLDFEWFSIWMVRFIALLEL